MSAAEVEKVPEAPYSQLDGADKSTQMGMFNIANYAQSKVIAKRKRKGLGQLHKRDKSAMDLILANGIALGLAHTAIAPLERARIIQQTRHMANLPASVEMPKGCGATIGRIVSD